VAVEFPDATSVRVSRRVNASPERVWRAFTDPADMAAWMWAGWGADTTADADVRVGGRYRVYTTAPEHETGWPTDRWGFLGYYTDVVENGRLAYTIHWDGPVGYNQTGAMVVDEAVIVEMSRSGTATDVVMWHVGIPADGVSAAEHGRGIEEMFGALDRLVAG
jgi:uncharacterized protein YndB with AHSA1/START domain